MGEIIGVDSVVYNMAGEEKDRPQYLKGLVVRNVLSETRDSIADSLQSGYLHGPAIKLRSFYRWAANPDNYGVVGMPTGRVTSYTMIDAALVTPHIPTTPPLEAWVQSAEVGGANPDFWARQWILANRPADIDAAWTATYNKSTNKVVVDFPDSSQQIITATNFNYNSKYVYAYYALDDNTVVPPVQGTLQVWIYRIGSGIPALDALVAEAGSYGQFFPFIPFRLSNEFISETYLPDAYPQVTKAYKKATGGKLAKLVEQLEDNEDLGDIDHGYIVFGVSLNVLEKSCRRYLYRFFEQLMASQSGGPTAYATAKAQYDSQASLVAPWLAWKSRQGGYNGGRDGDPPDDPQPPKPSFSPLPSNEIQITNEGSLDAKYDIRMHWCFVTAGSGTGLGRPGAKVGEVWLDDLGDDAATRAIYLVKNNGVDDDQYRYRKIRITWQTSTAAYDWLDIIGAVHFNYIYGGVAVKITAKAALADAEESGFIVPLHYDTWRQTSLVDTSQMATACVFAVFNCYVVKKKKWYQSGIFKVLLVVVIAIASVVFTGGAGIGLLGANLSIGTALGFSGMTAAIVGSIANAMAALVLSTMLEKVASSLGPLGQLVAAVLMIIVMDVAAAFHNGLAALNWGNLLRVDNLLKLVDAVGNGISAMINADTMGIQNAWEDFAEKAKTEARKIQQTYFEEFGYGGGQIDPLMFVDSSTKILAESSDTFLTRTLMTGSEIADMSRELLYNFSEYSLKLPDAFA